MSPSQPISPELALVCPELHRQWTAALPDVDPDELFRVVRTPHPIAAFATQAEARVPFLAAAAVYTVVRLAASLMHGVVTLAIVAVLALLLTLAG